jgi:hypothetical protein
MRPADDIRKMIENWNDTTSAQMDERVLADVGRALEQSQTQAAPAKPPLRRILMKNPMTRVAAAALFVGGVSLLVGLMIQTTPPAYGVGQTVEANNHLRSLRMATSSAGYDEPKEYWLQCDALGQIQKARWHMPAWDAPEDGAKEVVWKDGKIQIWFQGTDRRRPCLATYTQREAPVWLLNFARKSDPRFSIAQLKKEQAGGKVELEIQEATGATQPIIVTATYPPGDASSSRRLVLHVDPTTKLVASIETSTWADGKYSLQYRQQFSNYNVPIDPATFDLDGLVPAEVQRIDGDAANNSGLPQGTLSDDEIAVKVVRQFFEALMAQDYETAGQLYCGTPAEELKQGYFGKMRIIRIVAIDKPTPHPIPEIGGLRVPCKVEIEQDGAKSVWEPYGPFVRTIHKQSEDPRWEIHGGL